MTFDIYADRDKLTAAIEAARPFVSARKDGPGRFVTLAVTAGSLRITACDGEAFGTVACDVQAKRGGEVFANLAALADDVKTIRDTVIHIEVTGSLVARKLRVSGATDTRTTTLPEEVSVGLLPIPPAPAGDGWEVTAANLTAALTASSYAIATEDVRWGLNGLHAEVWRDGPHKGEIAFVATDGHRLALAWLVFTGDFTMPPRTLIPRNACRDLATLAGKVRIVVAEGWLHASVGSDRFGWRLLDGEFPDFRAILPTDTRNAVMCRRDELLGKVAATRRIASENGKTRPMAFDAVGGEVTLTARHEERETRSTLPGETEGEIRAGFNAEYLHQAVSKTVSDKVRIRGTHALAPYIVEPYDDGGSLAVIMPMRIDG